MVLLRPRARFLRETLLQVINGAAKTWGLECLRYEIKDILPPPAIVKAMELQAEAERRKRAQVLESEGMRQATINESEAQRVRPTFLHHADCTLHGSVNHHAEAVLHAGVWWLCCALGTV